MKRSKREADCGVCALANVLDISWAEAAFQIFGDRWWNKLRFNTKTRQLADALHEPHAKLIRVKDWRDIPDRSIVKVMPPECEGTSNWHWVVWRNGKVWDSNLTKPTAPRYYRPRLVSYIRDMSMTMVLDDVSEKNLRLFFTGET